MSFAFSLILCSQPNCSNSNKWTNKQANKHWYTTHISDTRLGNPLLDANEFKVCSTRYRTHTLLSKKRVKSVSNLGKDTKISITSHCVRYFVLNFVSPIPSQGFGSFYDECFLWEKCRTDQPNVVLVRPGIVQPWTSLEKKGRYRQALSCLYGTCPTLPRNKSFFVAGASVKVPLLLCTISWKTIKTQNLSFQRQVFNLCALNHGTLQKMSKDHPFLQN